MHSLLLDSSILARFWPEAIFAAVHLINWLLSLRIENQTPYFRLFQKLPAYSYLRTFGCVWFVFVPPIEHTKLTAQSAKCVFIGYTTNHKGFLCYDPKIKRIRVSLNVVFFSKISILSTSC